MEQKQKRNLNNISFVNLLFFMSATLMLFVSVIFTLYTDRMEETLQTSISSHLIAAANAASTMLTVEELDLFHTEDDMARPEWESIRTRLQKFASDYKVLYVYYWRYNDDGRIQYIIDNDEDPEYMVTPDLYFDIESDPATAEAVPVIMEGNTWASDLGIYTATWDGLISGLAPVFRDDGSVYCAAGVDLSDEIILTVQNNIRIIRSVQIISLFISIMSGFLAFQQYRKKAIQSENANKSKSQFLSTMSHEMRTPLNAIIGMTAIAKKTTDAEGKNHALGRIEDASSHLLGLINDVLDMAKIEANKLELSLVEFELAKVLQNALAITNFRVTDKQLSLAVDVDDTIPRYVIGDDQRLAQVIANLMSNAVKFTPEGGNIHFKASLIAENEGVCELQISVEDSGVGISPEQQGRMFHAFEQAESGTSREYGGTGLGLAISKRIVELMGGRIWVNSELGKGSTFTFTAKVQKSEKSSESEDSEAVCIDNNLITDTNVSASTKTGKNTGIYADKKMLLVEDIEINCEILMALLEDTDLSIDCAGNGEEALEIMKNSPNKYDIVFMDVHMPKMDGLEATRRIRALPDMKNSNLPIIAMTANVFKSNIEDCLEAGMNDHLGKPLDMDRVHEVLRMYLN